MAPAAMPEDGDVVDPSPESSSRTGSETAPEMDMDCILDSGSAVHLTGDAGSLTGARAPGPGDAASVTRRDGREMEVTAVGSIATAEFELHGVHCAPELGPRRTLVSVSQLAACGLAVAFGAAGCLVVDRTGVVVGEGRMRGGDGDGGGFYHLSFLRIPRILLPPRARRSLVLPPPLLRIILFVTALFYSGVFFLLNHAARALS